jgi:hypothetical protein
MTKLTYAFRDFANAPKRVFLVHFPRIVVTQLPLRALSRSHSGFSWFRASGMRSRVTGLELPDVSDERHTKGLNPNPSTQCHIPEEMNPWLSVDNITQILFSIFHLCQSAVNDTEMCERIATHYHSNKPVNPQLLSINTRKSVITHLRVVQFAVCPVLVIEPKTARQWHAKFISRDYGCAGLFVVAAKRTFPGLHDVILRNSNTSTNCNIT